LQACVTRIRNASVLNERGSPAEILDVAIRGNFIFEAGPSFEFRAAICVGPESLSLAPGFIDVHRHDDSKVIRTPEMLSKISQDETTVIVGGCGVSVAPVQLGGELPDSMNLLGSAEVFQYPAFAAYVGTITDARPAVNTGVLAGHTTLRNNHMDGLDRTAAAAEIMAMRAQLQEALVGGALGLSSGLAYL
jgi:N-acyl-D-amino-acid deacylase